MKQTNPLCSYVFMFFETFCQGFKIIEPVGVPLVWGILGFCPCNPKSDNRDKVYFCGKFTFKHVLLKIIEKAFTFANKLFLKNILFGNVKTLSNRQTFQSLFFGVFFFYLAFSNVPSFVVIKFLFMNLFLGYFKI